MPARRFSPQEIMERALREATRGLGRTHPNPAVGSVIAKGGRIIAVGHHARAGLPHAEAVALRRAGKRARGADVYVTLEPCDHHGRTPPCTGALIAAGVRRVIVGLRDPNPLVNGRGLRRLARAGIGVEVGLCAAACAAFNEAYLCAVRLGRPLVALKLAQSLDGRVATRGGESRWITGEAARALGHRLRNQYDAILVGVGTVLADDPRLNCRLRGGRDPIRIVLDTHARTPVRSQVVRMSRRSRAPTWVIVGPQAPLPRRRALERAGARVLVGKARRDRLDIDALLSLLHAQELNSVLIEGGPTVAGSFLDARRIDKVHAFVAPRLLGGTQARSGIEGMGAQKLAHSLDLKLNGVEEVGGDVLITASLRPPKF
ncbi:MAG: bifunctional diaminohydroxyphosphoribosylaminopyrimidine deaminase/5-amino-6-(5-phosphoribosylamino)uracil reductase RibD [Deltaproteobacteria bacterium]|nr:bifunctional diaminohydroxyphosphoribosylaminopyrimidine deaminase/5-amino-6-(5-phosphoribosylamino)uracil reductase RibD [Deltaproteobacteria bacterium]